MHSTILPAKMMPTSWPASRRSRLRYRFGLCGATAQLVGFFAEDETSFGNTGPALGFGGECRATIGLRAGIAHAGEQHCGDYGSTCHSVTPLSREIPECAVPLVEHAKRGRAERSLPNADCITG